MDSLLLLTIRRAYLVCLEATRGRSGRWRGRAPSPPGRGRRLASPHGPWRTPDRAPAPPRGAGGPCSLQGPYDRSATFFGRYDRCWPKAGPKALAVAEQPAAASVKSGL